MHSWQAAFADSSAGSRFSANVYHWWGCTWGGQWKGWAASHQSPSPLAGLIYNWSQTILYCLILEPRECVTNCPSCYCCITNYPKIQWLKAMIFFFLTHEVVVRKCLAGHLWLGVSDAAADRCGLGCIHLRAWWGWTSKQAPSHSWLPMPGSRLGAQPCWQLEHLHVA